MSDQRSRWWLCKWIPFSGERLSSYLLIQMAATFSAYFLLPPDIDTAVYDHVSTRKEWIPQSIILWCNHCWRLNRFLSAVFLISLPAANWSYGLYRLKRSFIGSCRGNVYNAHYSKADVSYQLYRRWFYHAQWIWTHIRCTVGDEKYSFHAENDKTLEVVKLGPLYYPLPTRHYVSSLLASFALYTIIYIDCWFFIHVTQTVGLRSLRRRWRGTCIVMWTISTMWGLGQNRTGGKVSRVSW